jgi:hypothetical protein
MRWSATSTVRTIPTVRSKSGIETRMTTSDTIMWLLMRVGIEKKFKIKLPSGG